MNFNIYLLLRIFGELLAALFEPLKSVNYFIFLDIQGKNELCRGVGAGNPIHLEEDFESRDYKVVVSKVG